jgi:hypothetical protein
MPRYGLLRNEIGRDTICFENFREFENSILADPDVAPIERGFITRYLSSVLFRIQRKFGSIFGKKPPYSVPLESNFHWRIAILGGLAFRRCPDFIRAGKKAAFLFDPSPPWTTIDEIKSFVEDTDISVLFVPHPDVCDELNGVLRNCRVFYIPEAVDPSVYNCECPKSIDVIAFGRKYSPHHQALLEGLDSSVIYHHQWLETREDFLTALAKSKIAMNFPRSITEDNCEIEMATMRYFQAMSSKALLIGHCPKVLKDLFGYDPVIKADFDDPCGQIHDILNRFEDYVPLIERNYQTLLQGNTYWHRWQAIKQKLEEETDLRIR